MNRRQRPSLANAKAQLRNAARKLRCKIDWGDWFIQSPEGRVFNDNGSDRLSFEPADWLNYRWEDQYRDAVRRLELGLEINPKVIN